MTGTKVLLVISDGVSLRNFIYSGFLNHAKQQGLEVELLNSTPFDLSYLDLNIHRYATTKPHPFTLVLKNILKRASLNVFYKRFNNPIYLDYKFPLNFGGFKLGVLSSMVYLLTPLSSNIKGVDYLRNLIKHFETKTKAYQNALALLRKIQPTVVYNCSQRAVQMIHVVQAAKQLHIPTVGFIYSWDNLPKATLDVETDHYHVWSDHMKQELLQYHPFIKPGQITVTGTPQFEFHFNKKLLQDRAAFLSSCDLDPSKKYLCFSGDDVTTSPHDPQYLEDVAKVVRELNREHDQWHMIFRRCPVDFSNRYDAVLQAYANEITPIAPKWQRLANSWDAVLPLKEDNAILLNTVAHCELVINLGSSMVFDAACQGTPCAYIAYNPEGVALQKDVHTIYKYIHFQSMPKEEPVFWLKDHETLKAVLDHLDTQSTSVLQQAKQWFETINSLESDKASQRIVKAITKISG